jgi:hypothetical protein
MLYKICKKCGKNLNELFFYKNKSSEDGLSFYCKECDKKNSKDYASKNREKLNKYHKDYSDKYRERIREIKRDCYHRNKEKYLSTRNKKLKEDVSFSLSFRFSNLLRIYLRGNKNNKKWQNIVGYDIKKLQKHLTETIPSGYGWIDYLGGKLHIDHIIPQSLYKFSSYNKEFRKCWNLRNLRLLESGENVSKQNKLDVLLIKEYNIFDLMPLEDK